MGDRYTRRRALQLGSAGLFAGLAGCGMLGGDSENSTSDDGTNPLDSVPEGSAMVAHVDVAQLLDGPVVQQGVEQALSLMADQRGTTGGPESYEDLLSMAESEFGLDPTAANTATVFVDPPESRGDPETAAAVVDADWSEADVVDALRAQGGSFPEREYGDAKLYVAESSGSSAAALGVLPDGRFVLGRTPGVETVVDTVAGEASSVGGTLATTYDGTAEGPIRFAVDIGSFPGEPSGPMANIETVSGGMAADGDSRTMAVTVEAVDDTAASGVRAIVENGLSNVQSQLDGAQDAPQQLREGLEQLQDVEVTKDGSTVAITYEAGVEEAGLFGTLLAAVVGSFVLGFGQSRAPRAPQVAFEVEYEADPGTVTITHQAGDTVPAGDLSVRGTTGNGRIDRPWTEFGVEGDVTAGTSVTVENVTAAYELRVIWVPSDEDVSAVLTSAQGPDA